MTYAILFYVVLGYLVIALMVAFYLRRELRRQLNVIETRGELECVAVGMATSAVLWPIWLVKLFIIGFVYVTKGR